MFKRFNDENNCYGYASNQTIIMRIFPKFFHHLNFRFKTIDEKKILCKFLRLCNLQLVVLIIPETFHNEFFKIAIKFCLLCRCTVSKNSILCFSTIFLKFCIFWLTFQFKFHINLKIFIFILVSFQFFLQVLEYWANIFIQRINLVFSFKICAYCQSLKWSLNVVCKISTKIHFFIKWLNNELPLKFNNQNIQSQSQTLPVISNLKGNMLVIFH